MTNIHDHKINVSKTRLDIIQPIFNKSTKDQHLQINFLTKFSYIALGL